MIVRFADARTGARGVGGAFGMVGMPGGFAGPGGAGGVEDLIGGGLLIGGTPRISLDPIAGLLYRFDIIRHRNTAGQPPKIRDDYLS